MTDKPRGLSGRHAVDAYGAGGFQFGGMSHRGSLLVLPDGIFPWEVETPDGISAASLAPVFAQAEAIDHLLIGTGASFAVVDSAVLAACRAHAIVPEPMASPAAARTFNILLGERRRVAAALVVAS